MDVREPFPELDELLDSMGEGGTRISEIGAGEAGVGNMSICLGWDIEVRRRFPIAEEIELPLPAPALAGRTLLVTGSGRRLRQIARDPLAAIGALRVHADGTSASLHTSPRRLFERLTTELNSHLAVHQDQVAQRDVRFQAVVHAQPPHLTYLSHLSTYRSPAMLNQRLLRWEPETIVALPEGIGVLVFLTPGSPELMAANVEGLRRFQVVLWSKHGVMSRSDLSVTRAVDRIEYAETAAHYEYMDLMAGGHGERLSDVELARIAEAYGVESPWVTPLG